MPAMSSRATDDSRFTRETREGSPIWQNLLLTVL